MAPRADSTDDRPARGPRWKHARRLAVFSVRVGLLVVLCMMLFERPLVFPAPHGGDWQPTRFRYEDAWFTAADGTSLHGWFLEQPGAREVVLYAHGNGEDVAYVAPWMDIMRRDLGVSILVFDYRGYGQSEGIPDEAGILADARAARAWLAQRTGKVEGDVVLFGRSLGGAVLVDLAAKDGARALILQSTFSSLPDVAAYHYPWLPVRWFMRTRLNAAAKIGAYTGPLLQTHGTADRVAPIEFGRRLFEAATAADKEFVELPGYDHNDADWPAVRPVVQRFLERVGSSK
jgi:fermentation-respiration switch protein FrsA (DUF1100 family)